MQPKDMKVKKKRQETRIVGHIECHQALRVVRKQEKPISIASFAYFK